MLEESEEAESDAEQPEEEEEDPKAKGRATGKDLVPCEVHPLDHVIESIIFDRLGTSKASVKSSVKKKGGDKKEKEA